MSVDGFGVCHYSFNDILITYTNMTRASNIPNENEHTNIHTQTCLQKEYGNYENEQPYRHNYVMRLTYHCDC